MIDVQQVRELAELMNEHGLSEIRFREGETALCLRRGPLGQPVVVSAPALPAAAPAAPATAPAGTAPAAPAQDEGLVPIKSPMVGTFYRAPAPDAPPYAEVGDRITEETVLCIVEAMKLMNEIKAETAGIVAEILVENGHPVEFGQPLFRIEPSE